MYKYVMGWENRGSFVSSSVVLKLCHLGSAELLFSLCLNVKEMLQGEREACTAERLG
jgi:hypothetical protein